MTTTFESAFKALKAANAAAEIDAAEGARTGNVEVMELADERVAEARSELREAYKRTFVETEKGSLLKADYEALEKLAKDNNKDVSEFIGRVIVENGRVVEARFNDLWLRDISALSSLARLTRLNLGFNRLIVDIRPLAQLTELTQLELYNNHVVDISPLAHLAKLTWLSLGSNQIVDIRPLVQLPVLTELELGGNQIVDISPLAQLTKLTMLSIPRNPLLKTEELRTLIEELKSRCYLDYEP